jgi:hypothetical protein
MDPTGFLSNLVSHAVDIDIGRKGLATDGEEHAGRIHYEEGVSGSLTSFREAQASADPQILVLAELVFLQQESQFCDEAFEYKLEPKSTTEWVLDWICTQFVLVSCEEVTSSKWKTIEGETSPNLPISREGR